MRSQLLSGALRRRPEFKVVSCSMSSDSILKPIQAESIDIILANTDHRDDLNRGFSILHRVHLTRPDIPKILIVDTYDRQLTINAFRSGVRGIFSFSESKFRDLCKCVHVVQSGQVWANTAQIRIFWNLSLTCPLSVPLASMAKACLLLARSKSSPWSQME